jgi:hypothetical protein
MDAPSSVIAIDFPSLVITMDRPSLCHSN